VERTSTSINDKCSFLIKYSRSQFFMHSQGTSKTAHKMRSSLKSENGFYINFQGKLHKSRCSHITFHRLSIDSQGDLKKFLLFNLYTKNFFFHICFSAYVFFFLPAPGFLRWFIEFVIVLSFSLCINILIKILLNLEKSWITGAQVH